MTSRTARHGGSSRTFSRTVIVLALIWNIVVPLLARDDAGDSPGGPVRASEAGTGALLRRTPEGLVPFPLLDHDVKLQVTGILVRGTLSQTFRNPTTEVIDCVYVFPLPNAPGRCVLAGHRDREFAFLRSLAPGDVLRLRTAGAAREYLVEEAGVVPGDDATALQPAEGDRLTLVTCYPFGGLTRSPLRYVVTTVARPVRAPAPITISSSAPAESARRQY